MKKLELLGGEHLHDAIVKAVAIAKKHRDSVSFRFNGKSHRVSANDTLESAKARASKVLGHPITTRDEDAERARLDLERITRESAEAIAAAKVPTEAELRATDAPWPKTPEELTAYIAALVDRPHDYGTCVYAMSLATTAAFHYVAEKLGVTGFQASCADLDVLRRTRGIKGPFLLMKGEDALYPQYDLPGRLAESMAEWQPWLAEEAAKKLAESNEHTHPNVLRHWRALAASKESV